MQLHDNPASPFCRIVQVLIRETGQANDVEIDPAIGHPLASEKMPVAQNPLGKIPTLSREEGPALYDSRVICRYLDARVSGGMYPDGDALWDALTLEATAHGIMDAAVLMVYEWRARPEEAYSKDWVEGQWAKVTRALDAIEARWMGHLAAPMNITHIAVGCALGYLDFRHADRDWRAGRPNLSAWFEGFATRESMKDTAPSA
ncbi:Glutathione S-transferase family protein [Candidatus Rhodobacter oscarellae]|uniref:Glutathione S-transferase family protein n=1 Tax=Candidatus Rhodobacter oscarellae TaxID=1675527 RepID=A0A0J9EFI0_9RHOB|nr:glutathione S-transferase family protein [Candidatus Rhodobacter lobularis]KMW60429.1 Glutathione S-transferase family protein [Candidatus Rhodobacter lobularis]